MVSSGVFHFLGEDLQRTEIIPKIDAANWKEYDTKEKAIKKKAGIALPFIEIEDTSILRYSSEKMEVKKE